MMKCKKDVLDAVCRTWRVRRAADLGCVWGVEGVYGQYIAGTYAPQEVVMVDTHWTEEARRLCEEHANITVLEENFGRVGLPERIGKVDLVILFDVLLHQCLPNWDDILSMYAPFTQCFAIANPQYTGSHRTVRLLDLGKEEYLKFIPHPPDHPTYKNLFEKMYEIHPEHGRIWRDVHHVWQWGITTADINDVMNRLGFKLIQGENHGPLDASKNFEYETFIFHKE